MSKSELDTVLEAHVQNPRKGLLHEGGEKHVHKNDKMAGTFAEASGPSSLVPCLVLGEYEPGNFR